MLLFSALFEEKHKLSYYINSQFYISQTTKDSKGLVLVLSIFSSQVHGLLILPPGFYFIFCMELVFDDRAGTGPQPCDTFSCFK